MKEDTQRRVFDHLMKKGIENFIGVPDSTLKHFVDQGLKKNKIIIATREEEAIGIATGMSLSKSPSLVFMQNAGFANSLSTITSLVEMYQIPLIFLIGWRLFVTLPLTEKPHEKCTIGLRYRPLRERFGEKSAKKLLNEIAAHTFILQARLL
ncbi:MAG: hypothetical protein EB170_09190, partial [Nitrosopumilaceae archaeon]|nr:hypothetical protein [Nitrosopumilaceae archaeon]